MAKYPSVAGSDARFDFPQNTPSSSWTIAHGLNKHPSVTVFEGAGNEIEGDIVHESLNQLKINYSLPVAGHAYLN